MSIESASNFLVGSVLLAVGFIVLIAGAVAINNLLHRYWKPVALFSADSWTMFGGKNYDEWIRNHPEVKAAEQAERIAPVLDIKEEKR
jgi:hypothetical protein